MVYNQQSTRVQYPCISNNVITAYDEYASADSNIHNDENAAELKIRNRLGFGVSKQFVS
jgi:hypothetical protein